MALLPFLKHTQTQFLLEGLQGTKKVCSFRGVRRGQRFFIFNDGNIRFLRTSGFGGAHESPRPLGQPSQSLNVPLQPVPGAEKEPNEEPPNIENITQDSLLERGTVKALTYMTKIFDTLTLPLYTIIQKPEKKLELHNTVKADLVDKFRMEYKSRTPKSPLHLEIEEYGLDTLVKLFSHAVKKNGTRQCLGTREIVGEEEITDPATGKTMKKLKLGNYKWKNFFEVNEDAERLSLGFAALGLKPKEKIAIFAETREEWLISAIAASMRNLTIVTIYTTLADDGIVHALNETGVKTLITTNELFPRCQHVLPQIPQIMNLICLDKELKGSKSSHNIPNVNVYTYKDMTTLGEKFKTVQENDNVNVAPKRNDPLMVMYTSGSTGVPKGVIISHWNLMSTLKSNADVLYQYDEAQPDDAYIGYLPLAHSLELMSEAMCLLQGIHIGYSSPLTLTDKSVGVQEGSKGDASILRPTCIIAVPLVLERIAKGIQEKVAEKSAFARTVFNYFFNYKTHWTRLGYDTPLVNKIFFKKMLELVGGRVRFVACGGAPLAPQTHEFIRTVLCCPVSLGYGLTETCGSGALAFNSDLTQGRVGGPIYCSKFRLVNWEDGGYRTTDKPYPRGEIYIGGDNVAVGYFKMPNSTDFFEENGMRWFKTGDIAEVHNDGVFKIIDRKKDLVKLSTGEFISLGKIESLFKTCPFIENICLVVNPTKPFPIAMVVPSHPYILKVAKSVNLDSEDVEALCKHDAINSEILKNITNQGVLMGLTKFDIPKKIHLCPEVWIPNSGLVTAAFKIRRIQVHSAFESEINSMFKNM